MFTLVKTAENKQAAKNGIKSAIVFFIVYSVVTLMIWYPFQEFNPTFNPYGTYSPTSSYFIIYWLFPFVVTLFVGAVLGILFVFLGKKISPLSVVVSIFFPVSLYILFTNITINKTGVGGFNVLYDLSSWLL